PTPLPLKVSPTPDQPSRLIVEMSKFDLQPPFIGRCTFSENFEDQAGAINYLNRCRLFQIALLHRAEGIVDDDQFSLLCLCKRGDAFHLPATEQRRRLAVANAEGLGRANVDTDRQRKPFGFFKPRIAVPP